MVKQSGICLKFRADLAGKLMILSLIILSQLIWDPLICLIMLKWGSFGMGGGGGVWVVELTLISVFLGSI